MWLPEEKTSMGSFDSSSKSSTVRPKPPAAFSMFTIVKSMRLRSMTRVRASTIARRPGEPTTSPTKRMFIRVEALSRVLHGPGLPDHRHLDLAGILQLGLDLLRDVARQPQSLVVRDAGRLDDDAQ